MANEQLGDQLIFGLADAGPLPTLVAAALLAAIPVLAMMTTSYLKISIVLSIVRSAFAAPGVPSSALTALLSMALTAQVMSPVAAEMLAVLRANESSTNQGENARVGSSGSAAPQAQGVQPNTRCLPSSRAQTDSQSRLRSRPGAGAQAGAQSREGTLFRDAIPSDGARGSKKPRVIGSLVSERVLEAPVAGTARRAGEGSEPARSVLPCLPSEAKSGERGLRSDDTHGSHDGAHGDSAPNVSETVWRARLAVLWSAVVPLEEFMRRHSGIRERRFFAMSRDSSSTPEVSKSEREPRNGVSSEKFEGESFATLVPAFLVSEAASAYRAGFYLYLPFVVIDLVVVNILVVLGMSMVNPVQISLPIKLAVFVLADGWFELSRSLVLAYQH